jgi:hypothetical protein
VNEVDRFAEGLDPLDADLQRYDNSVLASYVMQKGIEILREHGHTGDIKPIFFWFRAASHFNASAEKKEDDADTFVPFVLLPSEENKSWTFWGTTYEQSKPMMISPKRDSHAKALPVIPLASWACIGGVEYKQTSGQLVSTTMAAATSRIANLMGCIKNVSINTVITAIGFRNAGGEINLAFTEEKIPFLPLQDDATFAHGEITQANDLYTAWVRANVTVRVEDPSLTAIFPFPILICVFDRLYQQHQHGSLTILLERGTHFSIDSKALQECFFGSMAKQVRFKGQGGHESLVPTPKRATRLSKMQKLLASSSGYSIDSHTQKMIGDLSARELRPRFCKDLESKLASETHSPPQATPQKRKANAKIPREETSEDSDDDDVMQHSPLEDEDTAMPTVKKQKGKQSKATKQPAAKKKAAEVKEANASAHLPSPAVWPSPTFPPIPRPRILVDLPSSHSYPHISTTYPLAPLIPPPPPRRPSPAL